MRKVLQLLFICILAVVVSIVSAQDGTTPVEPSGAITIGQTIDVQTPDAYTLTVENIVPVTIVVRSLDGETNPSFTLLNPSGEVIFPVEVNATYRNDMGPKDIGIQNMMLTPGTYTITLDNAQQEDGSVVGDGRLSISVFEGNQGVLGAGHTEIVAGSITVEKPVYGLEINLTAGEVVTIASRVVSSELIGTPEPGTNPEEDPGLDTSMILYAPDGSIAASNDDHDSESLVLDFGDSQIARFVVPQTGTYKISVRDFEGRHIGDVWLIATRHGTLTPSTVEPVSYTGRVLSGGRRTFIFEAAENELVSIAAHATEPTLDTVITLYNPDGLPVVQNDDHSTLNPNLGQFDSAIQNYMVITPGQFEVDLQSYDNSGAYEVIISRVGTVQPTDSTAPLFGNETDVPVPTPVQ